MGRQYIIQITYIAYFLTAGCASLPLEDSIQRRAIAKYSWTYHYEFENLQKFTPPASWENLFELVKQCALEVNELERPDVTYRDLNWYIVDKLTTNKPIIQIPMGGRPGRVRVYYILGAFLWPNSIVLSRETRLVYHLEMAKIAMHELAHYVSPDAEHDGKFWSLCRIDK